MGKIKTTQRAPRQDYTMTEEQFRAMGGQTAPEGYDPEATITVEREGHFSGGIEKGKIVTRGPVGVNVRRTYNPTDRGAGWRPAELSVIQALAEAHGCRWLTINWPDRYSPDFTAVPA